MNLQIDFRSGIPIYLQVVERIKEHITSGWLKPGDQLPTVRSLALELRVNFNTVARSYRILDETGIISTQQGRGTYVMNIPPPEVSEKIRLKTLQELTRRYLADVERLGALPEEVNQNIKNMLAVWQQTGQLPDSEPEPDHD
jgi:GntR family transcriptional regulator